MSPDRFSLYSSLSSLSGGLTIFTTNSDIQRVSTIVEDNTAADKVAARFSDGEQHFTQLNQIKHVLKARKAATSVVPLCPCKTSSLVKIQQNTTKKSESVTMCSRNYVFCAGATGLAIIICVFVFAKDHFYIQVVM